MLNILIWSLLFFGAVILLSFVDSSYQTIQLKKINVNIDQSDGHSFITKTQVIRTLSDIGVNRKWRESRCFRL